MILFTLKENLPSLLSCNIGGNPAITGPSALKLHKTIMRRAADQMEEMEEEIEAIGEAFRRKDRKGSLPELERDDPLSSEDLEELFEMLKQKPILSPGEFLLKDSMMGILNPNFSLHEFLRFTTVLLQMSEAVSNASLADFADETGQSSR